MNRKQRRAAGTPPDRPIHYRGKSYSPMEAAALAAQLQSANNLPEAADICRLILAALPAHPAAHNNLGVLLQAMGRYDEARASYENAIALKGDYAEPYNNRGIILQGMGRYVEAVESYSRAIMLKPDYAEAFSNLGFALLEAKRYDEALSHSDRALALNHGLAEAHSNRALILQEMKRYDEAIAGYGRALAINPSYADAYNNLGNLFKETKRFDEAIAGMEKALALNPHIPYLPGVLLHTKMQVCRWDGLEALTTQVAAGIEAGKLVSTPLSIVSAPIDWRLQKKCAGMYVRHKFPAQKPLWNGERYAHDKIRVAYVSADFRKHPISFLMAGVFEHHDRSRFEIIGISFMPEDKSPIGQRVKNAFDRFIDVSKQSDEQVAMLLRKMEIDIAIDLMGFTLDFRTNIFAARPAPAQVNYLGYPATMGAPYIDYIIADTFVIPPQNREQYSEKIVCLPDCFQANDDKRPVINQAPERAKHGLPERGFVFCSFNNSYKITPEFFDMWMRLLGHVPGSVLWLLGGEAVERNLRDEAKKRGVDPMRLIFAPPMDYADHLARLPAADLFLDTLPFNAGTTASDALWAGLPLITCQGEAFAARMAASLLTAMGLPELIAADMKEYETLAMSLATEPAKLAAIKTRLTKNRATGPLFNTALFTRNLENAYTRMRELSDGGLPPEHIDV